MPGKMAIEDYAEQPMAEAERLMHDLYAAAQHRALAGPDSERAELPPPEQTIPRAWTASGTSLWTWRTSLANGKRDLPRPASGSLDRFRVRSEVMTWYRDLDPCPYFGPDHVHSLRAVGWLGAGKDFPTGPTRHDLVKKLRLQRKSQCNPWYGAFLGMHTCELCDDRSVGSWANLYIPGDGVVYVAPEGIIHYIEAHDYLPPLEFRNAVERCPPGDCVDYYEALAQAAPYLGTGQALLHQLRQRVEWLRESLAPYGREVPRQWFEEG